jgi:hypothetical protein
MPRLLLKVALLALVVALATAAFASSAPGRFSDFRAFYCAGQAQLSGADPYREHPLHECEQTVSAPGVPLMPYRATFPAPFPGFVLSLFAALALLPFAWALYIWEGAACLATGLGIVLVARTTRTSLTANAIVLGFPAAVVALQLGQVTPFVLLAVAGAASLLQSGRPRLAALAALGALLDPHVGLALGLGIAVCVPRARAVSIAGTVGLTGLGSLLSGPMREWEYLRSVIPAHAFANLTDSMQFSATNFAFEAGVRPTVALTLGGLWYVGALVAGVLVALRLRTGLGLGAVAYIPAAFVVFGGTHTHLQQLAIAVPAFMLLSSAAAGRRRDFFSVVTFVAAMPWLLMAPVPSLFVIPPVLAIVYTREMNTGRQGIRLAVGSLIALVAMMLTVLRSHTARKALNVHISGNPLAEVSWQAFTIARNVPADAWYLVARIPTVIAFVLLFAAFVRAAARKPSFLDERGTCPSG